jgi:choline dehydrogenase-like flavoprotein
MERLAHLSIAGVLLRDREPGRVVTGRDGIPRVEYSLSRSDTRNLRVALRGAAEVLAAQGATDIMTLQQPPVRARPGTAGWLGAFGAAMDARGFAAGRMSFITFHQMASCAMGRDPRHAVVSETGESHDVRGLYVADGSAFVTSSGVNPMLTIMALADHVARGLAERW